MKDVKNVSKILRLGIPPMIASIFLPGIIGNLNRVFPDLKLYIIEAGREELINKLAQDQVDVIFIPHVPTATSDILIKKITDLEISCCVSKKWELSRSKILKASDLRDIPVVLFDDSFFQTETVKKWFNHSQVKPNIILQTGQLSTLQSLVSSGVAAGFLFKNMTPAGDMIQHVPLEDKLTTDINLIWKKDNYMSNILRKFSKYVVELNIITN